MKAASASGVDSRPKGWKFYRDNLEAVLIAAILALIIRHYSIESFEIPTGSMAPGLHGVHFEGTCPNCSTVNSVGIRTDPFSGKVPPRHWSDGFIYDGPCSECGTGVREAARSSRPAPKVYCPSCRDHVVADPEAWSRSRFATTDVWCRECTLRFRVAYRPDEVQGGHKILVNKFAYHPGDPGRWDVIVFRFNRERNYIKRLVGMPGETIQIVDGDVHIDGEVCRKPTDVQEILWAKVYDSRVKERGIVVPAWNEAPGWIPAGDGSWEFNALDAQNPTGITYQRPVLNRYSYNGGDFRMGTTVVRDLALRLRVRAEEPKPGKSDAALILDIVNEPSRYRLTISVENSGGRIEILQEGGDPTVLIEIPTARLRPGQDHEVEFYCADRNLRLRIDGETIADVPLPVTESDSGTSRVEASSVSVLARHCGGHLGRIEILRDIHYTSSGISLKHALGNPYQIPVDGFFALGDNSPSSLDSRAWGALSRSNLLGRGFVIFWPALPGQFEMGFIR